MAQYFPGGGPGGGTNSGVSSFSAASTFPGLTFSVSNPTTTPSLTGSATLAQTANMFLASPDGVSGPIGERPIANTDLAGLSPAIGVANVTGSHTLPDGTLSLNVPLLNGTQTFTGANALTNTGNTFVGNGAGLTNVGTTIDRLRGCVTTFDDFLNVPVGASPPFGVFGFIDFVSGTAAQFLSKSGTTTAPGVIGISTGSTSNMTFVMSQLDSTSGGPLVFGGGNVYTNEWRVMWANLPNGTDAAATKIGFNIGRLNTVALETDGLYWQTSSNNISVVSIKGSTATTNSSFTTTLTANTWYDLRMVVTDTTGCVCTINGVDSQTIAANIPTNPISLCVKYFKTVGTTSFVFDMDYCYLSYSLGTGR